MSRREHPATYAVSRDAYYRTLECEPADKASNCERRTQMPPPQHLAVGDSSIIYDPLVEFPHIHGRIYMWEPLPNLQEPPFLREPPVDLGTVLE